MVELQTYAVAPEGKTAGQPEGVTLQIEDAQAALRRAEWHQVLVQCWKQIFLAEIREMQAASVGSPGGMNHD